MDKQRRSMGHATNLTKGCVKFVDLFDKKCDCSHILFIRRKFGRYALRSRKYKVDVIIELFVNPKKSGALKAYANANFIALEDLPSRELWKVSNFPLD